MKKAKLKSKRKFPKKISKKKSFRKNSQIHNLAEIEKQIIKLINEEQFVILVLPNSYCKKQGWPKERYKSYYGILKKRNKFVFQFNPLNQWKYQVKIKENQEKIQPIKRTSKEPEFIDYGNEFDHHLLIESEFENDEPTYEIEFSISDVFFIENENKIGMLSRPYIIKSII